MLQGTDPDTWSIKRTFEETGVINVHTLQKTRYGILGLWYDGVYVFDGAVTKNITRDQMGTDFFDGLSVTNSEWDGSKYYLFYSSGGTNYVLVIDFSDYPQLKFYNDNTALTAYEYHSPTGIKYMGKANGYQYEESGTETILNSLQTGDKVGDTILKMKNFQYLYYDVNTNSKDLTLTFIVDGSSHSTTVTINHASRTRKRIALGNYQGYRFSLALSAASGSGMTIYEPWAIEYTHYGD